MKNIFHIGIMFLFVIFLSSCAGSRKIDFDSAYKFSTYRYHKAPEDKSADRVGAENIELTVSLAQPSQADGQGSIREIEELLVEHMGSDAEVNDAEIKEEIWKEVRTMRASERKKLKREVRAELRKLKAEAEKKPNSMRVDQVSQMSDATRISIVAGSVGIVLLILGAIFSVSFLTFVGAIITVGAAILFIVDQV